MKKHVIAIAGNPNSGKSTLFNLLTGSRQRVGNWPGVTVDKKVGELKLPSGTAELVDLPGIYSLNAFSEDERICRDYLLSGEATLVLQVIDSTNLERNLYLTWQLRELGVPLLLIMNMEDLAKKHQIKLHPTKLAEELGIPVVAASAIQNNDAQPLVRAIESTLAIMDAKPPTALRLPQELQDEIELLTPAIEFFAQRKGLHPEWCAMKILEGDSQLEPQVISEQLVQADHLNETRERIRKIHGLLPDEWLAANRYEQIEEALAKSHHKTNKVQDSFTDRLDRIVMHRIWGFPIFLLAMYSVFWFTIHFGGAFIDFFDIAFGTLFVDGMRHVLESLGTPEPVIAIVADGIGAGIQTLSTFFPIIFVLFFLISILESSGYMARAAFVMDRLMRIIGLPGKAFIPMLVGFGCTVPAILATRALENRRDRILSVFIVPFMSCGARLPVYVLFAAAFFPGSGQNLVFGLYLIGILLAVLTGLLLKGTVYKGNLAPFIMELPSYHTPKFTAILRSAWFRLKSFIKNGGKILIPIIALLGILNSIGTDGSFGNQDSENSVLSKVGKAVTPIFTPMGVQEDNWPAAVGLFTGLFAKEVIVGTLNSLYSQESAKTVTSEPVAAASEFKLSRGLLEAVKTIPANLTGLGGTFLDPLGINVGSVEANEESAEGLAVDVSLFDTMRKFFHNSKAAAFAYLLFILLYVPCFVAVSASWKEVGSVLTWLQMLYSTVLGWTLATLTYQILEGHSMFWIVSAIGILIFSISAIIGFARRSGHFDGKVV